MKRYYLEVKTWKDGLVTMPGPFKVLGETTEYRSRSTGQDIPKALIKNAFLSFNEKVVDKFLNENVAACIVAMIIEESNEDAAIQLVSDCLGPIELDGIIEITKENIDQIQVVMGDALKDNPPEQLDS